MNFQHSVLVVIDMQNGFVNDRSRHVVEPVVRLVKEWQSAGGATVFTRFLNHPGGQYERLIHWQRMQSSPETDIIEELQPFVTNVVDKDYYSFFNEAGSRLHSEYGWTDLVFCGIATDSCVLKSAVDTFEQGLTPWVVSDASASHAGDETHKEGLHLIGRFIGRGQIIDSATLLAKLPSVAQG